MDKHLAHSAKFLEVDVKKEREHWITTESKTHLHYRVKARTRREALQKYRDGLAERVLCKESADERVIKILSLASHGS